MIILLLLFLSFWALIFILIKKFFFSKKTNKDRPIHVQKPYDPTKNYPNNTNPVTPEQTINIPPVEINKPKENTPIVIEPEVKQYTPKQSKIYTLSVPIECKESLKEVAAAPRFESWDLGKAIWSNFYRDAYNKMTDVKALEGSGIYKITNLTSGMVYIGQSVNIKERWRDHIRVGCGADFPSSSSQLYKDMYSQGPENFSYQVIDYCHGRSFLNEREKFWIAHYNSCVNGYNKTRGNK